MNILHIFPTAGFDRSITTPVLLGVLISWLFTETFGWVFAGLVVPGYLAAVFVLDPRSGMVDVAEAIFTFALARALGEHLARTGATSRVFGRERFLLVVVASVVVRLVVEGLILPRFAPHAAGSFFSIGLVVVPLAANACWKTGLARGIVQNGVPTLLVYLLLRFVLVPHTNISLAGFELATEDVAASFLSSPKAYILLITGAVLAAASNVLDGWDFNGILVPALLALVVVEPVKFVATFLEAIVLVLVVTLLLRTTRLGRWNVEGPRRLVLFFTIDYVLRFAFALVAGRSMSGLDVVGLMGFGYLLPTLLAVKISQRGSAALVVLPTAQISITAFALGTLIGFCASVVDGGTPIARAAVSRTMPAAPADPAMAATWTAALARSQPRDGSPLATRPERIVALVDQVLEQGDGAAAPLHFETQRLDGGVLLLRERFQQLGDRWGDPAVLVTKGGRAAAQRIVVYVSQPTAAPETAAVAGRLLANGTIDAVVIAGVEDVGRELDPFERSARETARALADRGAGVSERGLVIALRGAKDERVVAAYGARAGAVTRVAALLSTLGAEPGASTGEPPAPFDAVVEIPFAVVDRVVGGPAPIEASLASPGTLAGAIDPLRVDSAPVAPESLLATRRLLLEPLLSTEGVGARLPFVRRAATALGYRVIGPSPLAGGGEGLAVVPGDAPRPIALLVRTSGVKGTIIEAPQAHVGDLRDAAIRLGSSLGVDAWLLGLQPRGAARGGEMMRVAHAIAAYPGGGRTPAVVLVREAGSDWDNAGVVALGAWGGDQRGPLLDRVRAALGGIGLRSADAPIDLAARELAGRATLGDVPLVSIVLDTTALRLVSLDEARATTRMLLAKGTIEALDGEVIDVARTLAKQLSPGPGPATEELGELARRATLEGSIVARRALADAIAGGTARAAIARATGGDFLVVVAKRGKRLSISSISTDPRLAREPAAPPTQPTLAACAPALASGGGCIAEAL